MKKAVSLPLFLLFAMAGSMAAGLALYFLSIPVQSNRWETKLILLTMMWAPAAALFISQYTSTKILSMNDLGFNLPIKKWWKHGLLAWFGIPLFCLAAPFIGQALFLHDLDLAEFQGFRNFMEKQGSSLGADSARSLVILQLALIMVIPLLNAIPVLGEEIGWRGFLLPELCKRMSCERALLLSGVIWAIWHAPIIYFGYNYPGYPVSGIFAMILFCVIFGVILGWMRLQSGSIWPAVIGHGALNGSAGFMLLLSDAKGYNPLFSGILGLSGLMLPGLFCCWILVHVRQKKSLPF